MKTKREPTGKGSEAGSRGFRVTEMTLLASLAALAALGAVILTAFWIVSMVTDTSPPPSAESSRRPRISGAERGEAALPRDREPVVETSEIFAARDPFGSVRVGGQGTGGGSGDSAPSWARIIELISARRGAANVKIDERSFAATEGERFARHFRLVYASSGCATILFGDDLFTICEGERILK